MTQSRHTVAKLIARRFLRSPRSHSIINVMSWISVVAVGVPVAAMVILMSVFNGFDGIVRTMYSDFEPELTITPARGKVLTASEALREKVLSIDEVLSASYVLDGEALLTYGERKCTATVRGVDSLFTQTVAIEDMMSRGTLVKSCTNGSWQRAATNLLSSHSTAASMKSSSRIAVPTTTGTTCFGSGCAIAGCTPVASKFTQVSTTVSKGSSRT